MLVARRRGSQHHLVIRMVLPDSTTNGSRRDGGLHEPEHFMRIWIFVAALIAIAQPAFAAHSHRHAQHGAGTHHVHHVRHHHRFAYAHRVQRAAIESGYAMPQTFARTDAVDTPFFSDSSFPNRSWNRNANLYSWNQAWSANP